MRRTSHSKTWPQPLEAHQVGIPHWLMIEVVPDDEEPGAAGYVRYHDYNLIGRYCARWNPGEEHFGEIAVVHRLDGSGAETVTRWMQDKDGDIAFITATDNEVRHALGTAVAYAVLNRIGA